MRLKRLSESAILLAVALIIFRIEATVPMPIAVPGMKLGLANVVTLAALFLLPKGWVYGILILRVLIGSILTGNPMSAFYGFAGGTLCYLITMLFWKTVKPNQIWVLGVLGALFHNLGQIAVAIGLTQSFAIIGYLPFLLFAAVFTGTLTGWIVQLLIRRLTSIPSYRERIDHYFPKGEQK